MPDIRPSPAAPPPAWRLARRALPLLLLAPRPGRAAPQDVVAAIIEGMRQARDELAARAVIRATVDLVTATQYAAGRYHGMMAPADIARLSVLVETAWARLVRPALPQGRYDWLPDQAEGPDRLIPVRYRHPARDQAVVTTFRVRERNAGPRIMDCTVENVSVMVTIRSEVTALFQTNGGRPDEALDRLERSRPR